jgi:hypothetical protein
MNRWTYDAILNNVRLVAREDTNRTNGLVCQYAGVNERGDLYGSCVAGALFERIGILDSTFDDHGQLNESPELRTRLRREGFTQDAVVLLANVQVYADMGLYTERDMADSDGTWVGVDGTDDHGDSIYRHTWDEALKLALAKPVYDVLPNEVEDLDSAYQDNEG